MSQKPANTTNKVTFRNVTLIAAILAYLVIVLGGILRLSAPGGACLDWPTCFGSLQPPQEPVALLDYAHRSVTLLLAPFLILSAILAWKIEPRQRPTIITIFIALFSFILQVGIGAALALTPGENSWYSSAHLLLSLLMLAALLVAVVLSSYDTKTTGPLLVYRSPFARQSVLTFGLLTLLLISGALVSGSQVGEACNTWPLCQDGLGSINLINNFHRLLVALTGLFIIALVIRAWQSQRSQTVILSATTAAAVLYFAQALLGAKLANESFPAYLMVIHQATATGVWAASIVQIIATGRSQRSAQEEKAETAVAAQRQHLWRDLLALTKPIVVVLLLVTTYAGMVIAAQAWPPISVTFWTLLGGFMAAGGSGAINQFIDRNDDTRMQRTQKRPIPSGRLTPGEGLAFGIALTLGSFYIMVAFVNLLAALLSLAGIIYYVLLYSILLKKTTVQNIVIGGGAGAIPPLVGWAAATGSLNIPSLFLFAVIFMWTPPHFWALALVRRKDYARAGVPMLPVVRGEKETRWQIMIYTVELVGLTLLLPLFGLGGAVYLVGALVLGGWLLTAAWKVWKLGGNKLAWKMYRYSSMYLAFLFMVLMVDRLL